MLFPQEWASLGPVMSYLDGGTGSLVFQVAASGLLAMAFVYRSAIGKVKETFSKIARKG